MTAGRDRLLPAQGALLEVLDRIETIVDAETDALRKFKAVDLTDWNGRKSQGLLELSRAVRGLGHATVDERVTARLKQLRAKLDANRTVLSTHLRAAREITSVMAATIRDSESDGTYSNGMSRPASPW